MHWRFLWLGSCPDKLTNLPNVHLLASWTRCFSRVSRLAHPTNAWPGDNRSWPHRLCKGRQSSCSYLVRAGGGPQVLAWNRMVEPKSFCDGSAISSPMVCTADFIVKSEGMCHSGAVLHLCRTYHSPTRRGCGVLPWFIHRSVVYHGFGHYSVSINGGWAVRARPGHYRDHRCGAGVRAPTELGWRWYNTYIYNIIYYIILYHIILYYNILYYMI